MLAVVYVAINRFGVRLPLKPFFAVTSAFLYYMAFVFAGKAVAELQEGGLVGTTSVSWAPRIPALGIYPTVESLLAQAALVLLAIVAVRLDLPDRAGAAARRAPARRAPRGPDDKELVRSLERIDADLAEARAELERMRDRLVKPESKGVDVSSRSASRRAPLGRLPSTASTRFHRSSRYVARRRRSPSLRMRRNQNDPHRHDRQARSPAPG